MNSWASGSFFKHFGRPLKRRSIPSRHWIAFVFFVAFFSSASSTTLAVDKDWNGGGLFWNSAGNWTPAGIPTADDEVSIDDTANDTILLSNNAVADFLFIANGNDLVTQGLALTVDRTIQLEDSGTRLVIGSSTVSANAFFVSLNPGDAEVEINGGLVETTSDIRLHGILRGYGTLRDTTSTGSTSIIGGGTIIAENGTLTLESAGSDPGVIRLGNGTLDISDPNSTLWLEGPLDDLKGTIQIGEGSRLHTTRPVVLSETSDMQIDAGAGTASVTGNAFTTRGSITVNSGTALFDPDALLLFSLGSSLSIANGAQVTLGRRPLSFVGSVELNGGEITCSELLFSHASISGFGTISTTGLNSSFLNTDAPGVITATGGVLNINAATTLQDSSKTVAEADGELHFAVSPTHEGTIQLNGGTVTGAPLVNDGVITGFGTIASDDLDNQGELTADGGTLVINTPTTPDLDGLNDVGLVNAVTGNIHVTTPDISQVLFQAELNIGDGREFRMDEGGLLIRSGAAINFSGGTYIAPTLNVIGNVNVDTTPAAIDAEATFFSGSTTTLSANLELLGDTTINNGATFTGSADLVVEQSATLQTDGEVTFNHEVQNNGTLAPGTSAALINFGADFIQSATGILEIELGGTELTEFDRLVVSGLALLDGTLSVGLISDFVPDVGDTFEIISATFVIDEFDDPVIAALPAGLAIDVQYNNDSVMLEVVEGGIPGDFDFDDDVDGDDFLLWQRGGSPDPLSQSDLDDWQDNYGTVAPLVASSAVPEPGVMALSCSMIFVLGGATWRRRNLCSRHRARQTYQRLSRSDHPRGVGA